MRYLNRWTCHAGLLLSAALIAPGCTGSLTSSPPPQIGVAQNQQLHCGAADTYNNTSGKREYVHVVASNDCEFTAYLWIHFGNGNFIHKEIAPGGTFDQHTWLPNGGSIEFECTLVSSVNGKGCKFSTTVVRRQ